MSGLLHRLAARALGAPPTVRPVVGWPAEAAMQATADAPAPLAPERDAQPAPAAPRAPGPLPLAGVEPDAPASSMPRAHFSGESLEARIPPLVVSHEAAPPPMPPSARADVEGARLPPIAHGSAMRDLAPEVPRLLPPQRPASVFLAPAIAAAIAPSAASAHPALEETTEVHVSIGRIEVTALHEAPKQRREPARTRKPKSLEEYLAARQERRT